MAWSKKIFQRICLLYFSGSPVRASESVLALGVVETEQEAPLNLSGSSAGITEMIEPETADAKTDQALISPSHDGKVDDDDPEPIDMDLGNNSAQNPESNISEPLSENKEALGAKEKDESDDFEVIFSNLQPLRRVPRLRAVPVLKNTPAEIPPAVGKVNASGVSVVQRENPEVDDSAGDLRQLRSVARLRAVKFADEPAAKISLSTRSKLVIDPKSHRLEKLRKDPVIVAEVDLTEPNAGVVAIDH
jgi:hypothetical protein